MRGSCIVFAILLFAQLASSSRAHALLLSPMSASLAPSGEGATHTFELTNQFDRTIAVQLSIGERVQSATGAESVRRDAGISRRFVLFPASVSLKPKEKRLVRLAWRGEPHLDHELNFRLIAEQLPISGERKGDEAERRAAVNLLMKYIAAVYITPPESKSNVEILNVARAGAKMRIRIRNSGRRHQILRRFHLQWDGGSLDPEQPRELAGQNILAGQERDFEFAWPKSAQPTAKNYRLVVAP